MTTLYLVRHSQPDRAWTDDRTRPLTETGLRDRERVAGLLQDVRLDAAVSSPYRRSYDTIAPCAARHGLLIRTDERLRERAEGPDGGKPGMFERRWAEPDFHEEGGEPLGALERRNVEAIREILEEYQDKTVLIGTHGTALNTILRHYDPAYTREDFRRMVYFLPFVLRLRFDGQRYLGREELFWIEHLPDARG